MATGHFDSPNSAPSIVMCRGYYKNFQIVALDYANGKLTKRWHFDTYPNYQEYVHQGNHNLAVGDVDNDGKDEIMYGACAIDHDGTGLYSTGRGHGDAFYIWENLILAVKDYKWSLAMKVLICMVTAVLKCGMPLPEKSWLPFRVMDRTSADVWWLILIRKRRVQNLGIRTSG